MRSDGLRVAATLAGAVAQVVAPRFAPRRVDEVTETAPKLRARPVPATFAIWAPIFAGSGAYALSEAAASRRRDPALAALGWPLAAAFAANTAWELAVPRRRLDVGHACVMTSVAASARAYSALTTRRPEVASASRVAPVVGALLGWLVVASALSTGDLVARHRALGERGQTLLGIGLLASTGAAAAWSLRRPAPAAARTAFAGAVLWGLGGITCNRAIRRIDRLAAAAAAMPVVIARLGRQRPTDTA